MRRRNINREIAKSDFSPVFRHFVNVLINRVVVDNLPEEINEKFLLYHVLLFGRVLFFKKNGKFHVMWFSGKGKFNEYYIQKEFLIVNPWARETNGDYTEANACILYSDMNAYIENADVGLYDFVHDYSEIINAIDSSIRALAKNSKVIAFITGSTNSFVSSAKAMVKNLLDGDDSIGIMEESLIDSIKVNPISEKMDYKFSELIKARQYYISDFYQKIGISANMNMKAERLTDNESQLIDSVSDVDFEHILDNLNYSVKFINEQFGLNISFRLNEKEEVVDNSTMEDENEDVGDENGNNIETDNERNAASQNELRVQGDEPRPGTSVSETSSDGDGLTDSTGTEQPEESESEDSKVEININIEKAGDVNVEAESGTDDDEPVVNNSESEPKEEDNGKNNEDEEEGITKYTKERG